MTRRRALRVVAACCLSAAGIGSSLAQDPRGTIAQKEARSWLALTDRGDTLASWRAAGKQFQNAITADKWADSLKQVRPPLGALVERTALSTQFTKSFAGAPDGDYALLVFRSSFAKKTDSRETVTLEHEADGAWRVIGYLIG
ncbi:MAG TPA: DUF4019 domain-containing protein [Casimicrobiaceae bacterium]